MVLPELKWRATIVMEQSAVNRGRVEPLVFLLQASNWRFKSAQTPVKPAVLTILVMYYLPMGGASYFFLSVLVMRGSTHYP